MKIRIFLITLLSSVLISCNSSLDSYKGNYEIYDVKYINIPNDYFNFFLSKKKKLTSIGQRVFLLSEMKIKISENMENGMLKGSMNMVDYSKKKKGNNTNIVKNNFDLDLKNFENKKDTLHFDIENSITKRSGKKFKGYVTKNNSDTFIGIDKRLLGTRNYRFKSEWYKYDKNNYIVFKTTTKKNAVYNFYQKELDSINKIIIADKISNKEKIILEKSSRLIKKELNKIKN